MILDTQLLDKILPRVKVDIFLYIKKYQILERHHKEFLPETQTGYEKNVSRNVCFQSLYILKIFFCKNRVFSKPMKQMMVFNMRTIWNAFPFSNLYNTHIFFIVSGEILSELCAVQDQNLDWEIYYHYFHKVTLLLSQTLYE